MPESTLVTREILDRIVLLEKGIQELGKLVRSAADYIAHDPHSSLTKSRTVLERMLQRLYTHLVGHPPAKQMIGNVLHDKDFSGRLPTRIRARINFIREIANAGVHGGDVTAGDAFRVLSNLVDVLDWYVETIPPAKLDPNQTGEDTVQILSQVKERLGSQLRPEIIGVRFVQGTERCWLEITEDTVTAGYLQDRQTKRNDLSFVSDDDDQDGLYFPPRTPIALNADRLLQLDALSLANCTDLLTASAAEESYRNSLP